VTLDFKGKVALVTGAGNGLGRAYARRLAAMGARVVVNDLGGDLRGEGNSPRPAEAVVAEIRAAGGDAVASVTSVASAEGADAMVQLALREWGRLDIVVNNAGVVPDREPIDRTSDAEWERVLGVHLRGHINVLRAAWPHLLASDAGRVVNTTSSTMLGVAGALTYATAKGGVVGLTRSLAYEARDTNIKVNAILPFGSSRMSNGQFAALFEQQFDLASGEFGQRFTADAVAAGLALLCHPALPCSGEMFAIGGGTMARVFLGMAEGSAAGSPDGFLAEWDRVFTPAPFAVLTSSADYKSALLGRGQFELGQFGLGQSR
jgi:NAD(P)-dependent dehydrogenase (short-subunit alcohol dehydrogenase family)